MSLIEFWKGHLKSNILAPWSQPTWLDSLRAGQTNLTASGAHLGLLLLPLIARANHQIGSRNVAPWEWDVPGRCGNSDNSAWMHNRVSASVDKKNLFVMSKVICIRSLRINKCMSRNALFWFCLTPASCLSLLCFLTWSDLLTFATNKNCIFSNFVKE